MTRPIFVPFPVREFSSQSGKVKVVVLAKVDIGPRRRVGPYGEIDVLLVGHSLFKPIEATRDASKRNPHLLTNALARIFDISTAIYCP